MLRANFITADEAARKVKDGDTVCSIAMTLVSVSESILKALEKRFLESGHPSNLTLLHSCGQSDRKDGIQHFAHEGMVTRIIGSHWGLQPRWMDMIAKNQVDAYCLPQGQIAQLYHSMAWVMTDTGQQTTAYVNGAGQWMINCPRIQATGAIVLRWKDE